MYLMHYGVKGQKWGVRRYQNADGSLTEEGKKRYSQITNIGKTGGVIPKNSSLYRTTGSPNEKYKNNKRPVYVSTSKFDNAMWQDTFNGIEGDHNYSVKLTAIKDIKVAPQSEIGRLYLEDLKAHPYRNRWNTNDALDFTSDSSYVRDNKRSNDIRGGLNISLQSPTGKRIMKRLQDQGYDAVADMFGRDTSNDPLLILNPKDTIKVSKVFGEHDVTAKDAANANRITMSNNKNFNKNYNYYNKRNR